jgi:hypothetical protein
LRFLVVIILATAVVAGGIVFVMRSSRAGTPAIKECALHSLKVSLPLSGAGLGHIAYDIKLRNTSRLACTLAGYPAVVAPLTRVVPNAGHKVARASDELSGYSGGIYGSTKLVKAYARRLPVVVLRPDGYASFVVEYGDMVRAGCPKLTRFVVTLPRGGRSETFTLPVRGELCTQLVVHPILSGVTGFLDAQ